MQTPEQLKKIAEIKGKIKVAENEMLNGKSENLMANFQKKEVAKKELSDYLDEITPPEARELKQLIELKEGELSVLAEELKAAKEKLREVFPDSPEFKRTRAAGEVRKTVSMTSELKAQIIELKKSGKRNIEIQEITGLNNGQISPILQKAGLTEKKK